MHLRWDNFHNKIYLLILAEKTFAVQLSQLFIYQRSWSKKNCGKLSGYLSSNNAWNCPWDWSNGNLSLILYSSFQWEYADMEIIQLSRILLQGLAFSDELHELITGVGLNHVRWKETIIPWINLPGSTFSGNYENHANSSFHFEWPWRLEKVKKEREFK